MATTNITIIIITGPINLTIAVSWVGDHSLLLLTKRRARFCLEILPRETNSNNNNNNNNNNLHRIIPLPPGCNPNFMEVLVDKNIFTGSDNSNSNNSASSSCVVLVGDRVCFIAYKITFELGLTCLVIIIIIIIIIIVFIIIGCC